MSFSEIHSEEKTLAEAPRGRRQGRVNVLSRIKYSGSLYHGSRISGLNKVWAEAIWERSCGCGTGEVAPRSRSSAVLSEDTLSSQRPRQAAHNCCNSSSWGSHTLSRLHGTDMHPAHAPHRHGHIRKNKSSKDMTTDLTFWSLVPKELHNIYSIVYNREWWFKSRKRRAPHRFYFFLFNYNYLIIYS